MHHIKGWMHYISNCRYSYMKCIAYKNIAFADLLLAFESSKIWPNSKMCQSGPPSCLWLSYLHDSPLMYHIKGWMRYISGRSYLRWWARTEVNVISAYLHQQLLIFIYEIYCIYQYSCCWSFTSICTIKIWPECNMSQSSPPSWLWLWNLYFNLLRY